MSRRFTLCFAYVALTVAAARPAAAAADGHLGGPGQLFFGGSSGLTLGAQRATGDSAADTEWYFSLAPSAGVFFHPNGFVSLTLTGSYGADSGASEGDVGLGPSVGMRLPIGRSAHFLPHVGLFYAHQRSVSAERFAAGAILTTSATQTNTLAIRASLPFVIELRSGFGLTVGPAFSQQVYARNDGGALLKLGRATIDVGLLGWLG